MIKKILALFICVLFCISFIGCDSTKNAYIYFELPKTPSTLDPQIASEDSELLIIKNIFEGLVRYNEKGEIVCGVAESYEKSGLEYTFKLRDNAVWSDGEKITAEDFEYAIKRAINPETKAPFASRLFCIKGAKSVNEGQAGLNLVACKAVNKTTLKITLETENENFLDTLTTSVAMPCRESFFIESAGKYGLFADKILSNGSYRLSRWRKDPFGIRLYRNEEYNGEIEANNAAVFLTCDKDETPIDRLVDNNVDMAFIDSALIQKLDNAGLNYSEIENICWVLTFGDEFPQNLRKSLSLLVGGEVFSNNLPRGYSVANSVYPKIFDIQSTSVGMTVYNSKTAKELYKSAIGYYEDSKFPSDIILYYYDDGYIKNIVTDIVGHWQSNLSAFVNIESVSDSGLLESQLINQDYPMAIFPIKAESRRLAEYLKKFGVDYSNQSVSSIQQELLKSNNIVPIMFQNTVLGYSKALSNVKTVSGDGYVDFAFIIKEES